jgi:GAF domain-containing protein
MLTPRLAEAARIVARDHADTCTIWRVTGVALDPLAFAAREPDAEVLLREMLRIEQRPPTALEARAIAERRFVVEARTSLVAKRNVPPAYWPYLPRYGLRCAIVVPIVAHAIVVGLLGASRHAAESVFSPEDVDALEAISAATGSFF